LIEQGMLRTDGLALVLICRVATAALAAAIIASCSNDPRATIMPANRAEWAAQDFKKRIDKLSLEDQKALASFMARVYLGELPVNDAAGLTVAQAIEKQREHDRQTIRREAEALALKQRTEQVRAQKRKELEDAAVVTLVSKTHRGKNFDAGRYSDDLVVVIALQNKTDKDIAGVKGALHVTDLFDDPVSAIRFSYDGGIPAGKSATWTGARQVNQFDRADQRLMNIEEGKYKVRFEPQGIVFKDGSRITAVD
jgi:hypothetical protein